MIRIRIETEMMRFGSKHIFGCFEQLMPIGCERIFVRPYALHDLETRIATVRVNTDQPTTRSQRTRERRNNFCSLEFRGCAGAIRLRGDYEIKLRTRNAGLWSNGIEQRSLILAKNHECNRAVVNRVAAGGTHFCGPVPRQKGLQIGQLSFELSSCVT